MPSSKAALPVQVREARLSDQDSLVAFNRALALESEGLTLALPVIQAGVARALATPTLCRYLVAEVGSQVVGQTMFTYELTDWRDGLIYWIQSVYVQPELRGQGVFAALYRQVEALARAAGDVRGIKLYVEKDNAVAISVYERLGMQRSHFHIYEARI